ncbi:hypothetical protein K2173_016637 [Erythroxylum novogranatense]|uniref:FAS1 domain-containing protein n=1 Tax=Erythroxylum novogranatense TaxID=1862640 RepID=A0AAV8SHC6_9ROSI|nr:hypothetical protein K2173_016637 [Erythroxylum novogranatense]
MEWVAGLTIAMMSKQVTFYTCTRPCKPCRARRFMNYDSIATAETTLPQDKMSGKAQSPAVAPAKPPPAAPPVKSPTAAQIPATSSGTPEIDKILTKAGHSTTFVRLLKATGEDSELFSELNTTNNGFTVFAPTDGAWATLKVGTLNTLGEGEKIELVQYHVVTKFISMSDFQTISNPVTTQAGKGDRVSFNIIVSGASVNISTGLSNATVSATIYADNQLAIYQIDNVLLPRDLFGSKGPSAAPSPADTLGKPKKGPASVTAEGPVGPKDKSGAWSLVLQNNLAMVPIAASRALNLAEYVNEMKCDC